jgi:hypothetical protein
MLRKQRRFDRKNVIARDVPGRVDAFENNMQRGRVAFGDIRHAESSARLCPASNAKFESVMLIRFQKLIDVDRMEQWLFEEGCDCFNVMFPYVPEGLDGFVYKVIPELQRRGLFRREYEGKTLRENLGLPRPENQFFTSSNNKPAHAHTSSLRVDLLRKVKSYD